jgi:uncharacterized protein (TIGR02452 family)
VTKGWVKFGVFDTDQLRKLYLVRIVKDSRTDRRELSGFIRRPNDSGLARTFGQGGKHAMNAQTKISRELAAEYGREAVQITQSGSYTSPSGKVVDISDRVRSAAQDTRSYPPGSPVPESITGTNPTGIEVLNDTTLAAAQRLIAAGHQPVALNFASATHPGGGFLNGARAQEEYLTRSSALFACLRDNPMYEYHQSRYDPIYTDYTIYSPGVPVFRSDDGSLLEQPYTVGIITSAAVNASRLDARRHPEVGPAMWARILKVLAIGLLHGHDAIVLGAWGCGAFGNDGREIAGLFKRALDENFKGAYKRVLFAIVDWSPEKRFIGPFCQAFEMAGF